MAKRASDLCSSVTEPSDTERKSLAKLFAPSSTAIRKRPMSFDPQAAFSSKRRKKV